MCEKNNMLVIEKIGDYKKESKRFIKGLVKSKLFRNENDGLTINICKDDFDKKLKMGAVTISAVDQFGMSASYTIMASTRVYNKIDEVLFESLITQLSKIKNFGGLTVIE